MTYKKEIVLKHGLQLELERRFLSKPMNPIIKASIEEYLYGLMDQVKYGSLRITPVAPVNLTNAEAPMIDVRLNPSVFFLPKILRPVIIAIVGDSGAGKTTLTQYLNREYGIPELCSYTTRPMRPGEVDGVDHFFVQSDRKPYMSAMLAYTEFGDYEYWTELKDVGMGPQTYVIDEKGLRQLMTVYRHIVTVVPIHISRPDNPTDENRKKRDKNRIVIGDVFVAKIINDYPTVEEYLVNASQEIQRVYNIIINEKE